MSTVEEKKVITESSQQGYIGFGCKQCEAAYKHRDSLYQHIQTVPEAKMYECIQCDFEDTWKDILIKPYKIR